MSEVTVSKEELEVLKKLAKWRDIVKKADSLEKNEVILGAQYGKTHVYLETGEFDVIDNIIKRVENV